MASGVPQQLLFSGGSGLGKTTVARIVAAAMLCETPMVDRDRGDACGSCDSCHAVTSSTHPDLIEFDAASHGGKDEIREIAARCQVLPLRAAVKIYIIDEAHGLSNPGGQAFLKLLEEPPAHVRFMLCTTDPQRMLKTNRGRCVEFELLPPTRKELLTNLQRITTAEGWSTPSGVFDAVLDASDPDLGVRGTVTTLAKLATVLADGSRVSSELVATLLGSPSPVVLKRLLTAIREGDRQRALQALSSARASTPDALLRSALVSWASNEVTQALSGSEEDLAVALARLEAILDAPTDPVWLDIVVARLASPVLDGERAAPVLSAEVIGMLEKLQQPAVASAPPTSTPSNSPSPGVAQLLAAATPASPEMRSLLPKCQVTISESEVELVAPDELVDSLKPLVPALRTAAGRLGLPLKLKKASSGR
jgi:DNA polymerase-3 subunit gamma/tau